MTEYIEKQAALKWVCDACGIVPDREKEYCEYKFAGCKEYYNVFALPPADVRPLVHGKWIKLDMHRGMEQYKCSICRSECYVPECMGEPMYGYCPCCGADMMGEE